jgi:hypothetical protein
MRLYADAAVYMFEVRRVTLVEKGFREESQVSYKGKAAMDTDGYVKVVAKVATEGKGNDAKVLVVMRLQTITRYRCR